MNLLLEGNKVRELNGVRGSSFWVMVGSWWLMMTYFIPISLVVTLELVKLFQGNYMIKDPRMYSSMTDTMPMMNNSTVNENLGQIKYIFSDKTGTLTSNIMNFKCLSTAGKIFGTKNTLSDAQLERLPKVTNVDFRDSEFITEAQKY
jgi:phospholipid-transporting ATPase